MFADLLRTLLHLLLPQPQLRPIPIRSDRRGDPRT